MAEMLEVSCSVCSAHEIQLDGPLMTGHQPRCEECGETRLVPPRAHVGGVVPHRWDDEDLAEWVSNQAGTCSCGGRFSLDAPLRCLACCSPDVTTTYVGSAD